jgi:hypothetical protein
MNKSKLLMAVAAVALIAGTGGALAQAEPPHVAPAEKTAPKTPAGEIHQNTAPSGGAVHKGEADINRKNAEGGDRAKSNGRSETSGQAPQEGRDSDRKEQRATEQKKPDAKASEEKASHATTGQAAAPAKGANITPENRTRIHDVFVKEHSAPRVEHVDFGLSVGTAVPRSVRIVAVPETIIELQPTWRGYEYFLVGDQIVIVDPRTMEIVAVLDA